MRDAPAALLDARGRLLVQEVNRHRHPNDLVLNDALQVEVQNESFSRVHLHILEDALAGLTLNADAQHAGKK